MTSFVILNEIVKKTWLDYKIDKDISIISRKKKEVICEKEEDINNLTMWIKDYIQNFRSTNCCNQMCLCISLHKILQRHRQTPKNFARNEFKLELAQFTSHFWMKYGSKSTRTKSTISDSVQFRELKEEWYHVDKLDKKK
jgi:hypothetical protein